VYDAHGVCVYEANPPPLYAKSTGEGARGVGRPYFGHLSEILVNMNRLVNIQSIAFVLTYTLFFERRKIKKNSKEKRENKFKVFWVFFNKLPSNFHTKIVPGKTLLQASVFESDIEKSDFGGTAEETCGERGAICAGVNRMEAATF
jgi:hypothetical protein